MTTAKIPLPPKALKVYSRPARYRCLYGGRGSGKTRAFALMTAVDGYRLGRSGISGLMLCAREHLINLDESSMEEVKQAIISVPWLSAYYEIGEKFIRSRDGRIKYAFTGLRHNLAGIKSKARILRAWVDEAENVSEAAWRMLIPTVRDQGDGWQSEIWVSWNPESPESATHKRFRANPPDSAAVEMMNWQDNPWFPDVLEQERLSDLKNRPEIYEHVWEGAFLVITDAQVFRDKFVMDRFEPDSDWNGPYHGLDFGFANDPTAAVQAYIHGRNLYIRREFFQKKLDIDKTPGALATAIPRIAMYTVRCDSSRPESISYLRHHGIPMATAALKGRGSVEDGIEYLKSFDKIIIHEDCPEIYREFCNYSYKVDRLSGDILPIPMDLYNHGIDALRYALEPMMRQRRRPGIRAL